MSRRVDQVERVRRAVGGEVSEPHRLGLDGDAAFSLQVHGVEHLLPHLTRTDRPGPLQEAVGQGRLAMVDVGDDAEVADTSHVAHDEDGRRRTDGQPDPANIPLRHPLGRQTLQMHPVL